MVMLIQIYVPNRDGGIGVVGFASKSGGIRVFRERYWLILIGWAAESKEDKLRPLEAEVSFYYY